MPSDPSSSAPASIPIPMLDLSRESPELRQQIFTAIRAVCDAKQFILGPPVAQFEQHAAAACAVPHAVGCASGTDALWLALAALGIGSSASCLPSGSVSDGVQAVITSSFSFFATASAILRAGARPVFADIDPRTFNLSPDSVAAVLRTTANVRAILPVHLYGQCADMDALGALAHAAGVPIVEDAAQAFGAFWTPPDQPAQPAGSLGTIAAFSFYPTKNLSAYGDAGLLTTSDPALDRHARSLRAHGMTRRYYHDEVGWNSRLDTLQAAVLDTKLPYVTLWNRQRRHLAARYDELFHSAGLTAEGVVLPWTDPRATHVFHQYVIRAPRRDALRDHLTALGIGSEVYYPVPLHLQAALKDLGYRPGDFPHAERAAAEVLALPVYPELREDEQQAVVDAVRRFYA